jgi:hypothetical protein
MAALSGLTSHGVKHNVSNIVIKSSLEKPVEGEKSRRRRLFRSVTLKHLSQFEDWRITAATSIEDFRVIRGSPVTVQVRNNRPVWFDTKTG